MKKKICFFILLVFMSSVVFAQDNSISDTVNRCIAMLGKPVPNGFTRVNRTKFINDEGIGLDVENGIVTTVTLWNVLETFNDAYKINGKVYDYFENSRNNWKLFYSSEDGDSYSRNGIVATIAKPSRRDDGKIFIAIVFGKGL